MLHASGSTSSLEEGQGSRESERVPIRCWPMNPEPAIRLQERLSVEGVAESPFGSSAGAARRRAAGASQDRCLC